MSDHPMICECGHRNGVEAVRGVRTREENCHVLRIVSFTCASCSRALEVTTHVDSGPGATEAVAKLEDRLSSLRDELSDAYIALEAAEEQIDEIEHEIALVERDIKSARGEEAA